MNQKPRSTFDKFVLKSLAYVTGRTIDGLADNLTGPEREQQLLFNLSQGHFLVVLDGIERILLAYARMDAAQLLDAAFEDDTNPPNGIDPTVGRAPRLSHATRHKLRRTIDVRAGQFLRKLLGIRSSRVLISTRLFPADLEAASGGTLTGCYRLTLKCLSDQDALDLWRALGSKGSRHVLLPVFRSFGNHPLLVQVLAAEVAHFRESPGDFEAWRLANPEFNPFNLPLVQVQSHVLDFALRGLSPAELRTLHVIAGFRMPADMYALSSLLIANPDEDADGGRPKKRHKKEKRQSTHRRRQRELEVDDIFEDEVGQQLREFVLSEVQGTVRPEIRGFQVRGPDDLKDEGNATATSPEKPFRDMRHLDMALSSLEDRGLLGWDRRANRYDLHPVVRGVVWGCLDEDHRHRIYRSLHGHFSSISLLEQSDMQSADDLAPGIELFNTLVGLRRYDEAFEVFRERLDGATLRSPEAMRHRIELLECLFPDGLHAEPRLSEAENRSEALNAFAESYLLSGEPGAAADVFRRASAIWGMDADRTEAEIGMFQQADALRQCGRLREALAASRMALILTRKYGKRVLEGVSLCWYGRVANVCGDVSSAIVALQRARRLFLERTDQVGECQACKCLAETEMFRHRPTEAGEYARQARRVADALGTVSLGIWAFRVLGMVALRDGSTSEASYALLHAATSKARGCGLVDEELAALVDLAQWYFKFRGPERVREVLEDLWGAAERGPFPLVEADALNLCSLAEARLGQHELAVADARRAFQRAWCDAPPFAYQRALAQSQLQLNELGVAWPDPPAANSRQSAPLPDVELDPPDTEA